MTKVDVTVGAKPVLELSSAKHIEIFIATDLRLLYFTLRDSCASLRRFGANGDNTDKPRQIGVSQVGYLPFSVVNFDLNDTIELGGGKLANILEDYLANKLPLGNKPLNTLRLHTYVCSLENSSVGDLPSSYIG